MGKNKIFVECHEANHFCDKAQYNEASFWEKVRLNIHLIYCRACRKYTARNIKLTKLTKNSKVQTISANDKEAMKERLQRELSGK